MSLDVVEKIANAVLYEGYILYPYRASAVKNRQRFNFGALYPPAHCRAQNGAGSDSDTMRIECLVLAGPSGQGTADDGKVGEVILEARVRFLHAQSREIFQRRSPAGGGDEAGSHGEPEAAADMDYQPVGSLVVDGRVHQTWQEAVERDVVASGLSLDELAARPATRAIRLPGGAVDEPLFDRAGEEVGRVVRRRREGAALVTLSADRLADRLFKLRVEIANSTPLDDSVLADRDEVLLATLLSTHALLRVAGGEFVSLLEPPEEFCAAAAACRNVGAWPVLVGESPRRDRMLASPIILYDYPQVAPESSGDWCDGAEIDEMLMLRVTTLTGDEKIAMRDVDPRAREILERAEFMSEDERLKLHGALGGLERGAPRGRDHGPLDDLGHGAGSRPAGEAKG